MENVNNNFQDFFFSTNQVFVIQIEIYEKIVNSKKCDNVNSTR